ncbi:DNA-3-methyladenine glycosylase [Phocicoccus pinnipedialis]|uniref:Putative 3-methyladenine DNA glycosylase n=1 Tax=Phocicoccus pinnipedialis TaxID=110845 RepID=A0A6V7RNY9_9BACL|nr:DNA-3-methyladenine glycosylase [Jeotgalicoccus pinnipedialis]MBP1940255.1 DNA-3-methyladenine glycosylase [Jeotgalicoccus pinnipedialis]CAD2079467.1 Putative 3-methyladenine DNA glycosylase [Jeotgalicoccus pinnipedialis]
MEKKPIDISFLGRSTLDAAQQLLGKEIETVIDGEVTSGFITEVEAYLGSNDRAAHTFDGKVTKKNAMMFEPYGHIYVYTIHGHNCMNFVTTTEQAEGVLIRAVEPSIGQNIMAERRGRSKNLSDGPGKLTEALGINRNDHNGMHINGTILKIYGGKTPKKIEATKRIGIDNKEEAVDYLYRFIVKGNPHVSRFKGIKDIDNGWK